MGRGYDPDAIPVRDAATVLILADRPDLQVLMLQRNARSVFVGDMWVFPGGAVDPGDATSAADAMVSDLTDTEASRQLGLDRGGIAFWVAALRETFEEAGVLLGHPVDATVPRADIGPRMRRHQDAVNRGVADFLGVVRTEGVVLDGAGVHYVSRWVTPVGPPRRYDTRFFVTAMPPGQTAVHDDDEAVHHEWVRAADALEANRHGEMSMLTPTVAMLQRLARFESVAAAMEAASTAGPDDDEILRIRYGTDGPDRIAFPADPDYDAADPHVEHGVIRWPC